MSSIVLATTSKARIAQDGLCVALEINGIATSIPWKAADEIARQLIATARRCEEIEKAEQIATDDAILLRSGAPFRLTQNRKIQEMAEKKGPLDLFRRTFTGFTAR